jgi:hypothetical protein
MGSNSGLKSHLKELVPRGAASVVKSYFIIT